MFRSLSVITALFSILSLGNGIKTHNGKKSQVAEPTDFLALTYNDGHVEAFPIDVCISKGMRVKVPTDYPDFYGTGVDAVLFMYNTYETDDCSGEPDGSFPAYFPATFSPGFDYFAAYTQTPMPTKRVATVKKFNDDCGHPGAVAFLSTFYPVGRCYEGNIYTCEGTNVRVVPCDTASDVSTSALYSSDECSGGNHMYACKVLPSELLDPTTR